MGRIERITITDDTISKLKTEKNRTGLGGRALLRGKRGEYPRGLTGAMIDKWRAGSIATAKPDYLRWVLKEYEAWTPPPPPDARTKMSLTEEHRALIQREVKRTGLGAVAILKHAPKPLPKGLNHQKVQRWISGDTKLVLKANFEFVLKLYSNIR